MSARRFVALILSAALLFLTSCSIPCLEKTISLDEARLSDDIVFALRLSPQLSDIGYGAKEGYVLLAHDDGKLDALNVGFMDNGKLVWTDNGLFFGNSETEYQLTSAGLKSQSRKNSEEYETTRFANAANDGFISLYNTGFTENGYLNRVVVGNGSELQTWDASGMFTSIAQCGEKIVGITDGKELDFATRKILKYPKDSDVLIQLYPQPQTIDERVLGEFYRGSEYEFSQAIEKTPCVDGVMYTLAEKYFFDYPENSEQVLRSWNIASGEHKYIPLKFNNLDAAYFEENDSGEEQGSLTDSASAFLWASFIDGSVNTLDLATGTVSHLFTINLSDPRSDSQFFVTEDDILVLDIDEERDLLTLSNYNIQTQKKTHYLDVKNRNKVNPLLMPRNIIRDIAFNPKWLASHNK